MKSQYTSQKALLVRAELMRRGFNLSDVARMEKVSSSLISRVITGHTRSARIEKRICQITGISRSVLFAGVRVVRKRHGCAPVYAAVS